MSQMLQATDQNFKKLRIRMKSDYTPEIGEGLLLSDIPKSARASVDTLIRMGALKIVEVTKEQEPSPIIPVDAHFEEEVISDPPVLKKKSNQGGGK